MTIRFTKHQLMLLFVCIIVSAVVLHAMTAYWVPTWSDDVMQMEPAVNWILGRGFVSYAQSSQSVALTYATNNTLYPFLLVPWFKIFGTSVTSARVFDQLLALAALALASSGLYRAGFFKTRTAQVAAVVLALCLDSVAFVYRVGRADSATMLAVALIAYTYCRVRTHRVKSWWLLPAAMFIVPAGIHAIPYVLVLSLVCFYLDSSFRVSHGAWVIAGMLSGLIGLLAYYKTQGTLTVFSQSTFGSGSNILGALAQVAIIRDVKSLERLVDILHNLEPLGVLRAAANDRSVLFMGAAMIVVIFATKDGGRMRKPALTGLFVAAAIPFSMLLAGRYPSYYIWMAGVPVTFCFCATLEMALEETDRKVLHGVLVATSVAACLQGLPMHLVGSFREYGPVGHAQVTALCDAVMKDGDVVYGDPLIYFQAKKRDLTFFTPTYAGGRGYPRMSEAERQSITLMVLKEGEIEEGQRRIGGAWKVQETRAFQTGMLGSKDCLNRIVVARRSSLFGWQLPPSIPSQNTNTATQLKIGV